MSYLNIPENVTVGSGYMKIFLGGTCNNSTWRDELVPLLKEADIEYFNPVVDDWTAECQAEEYRQKEICDVHLYVITEEMTGVFSIAEAITKGKLCLFQVFPMKDSKQYNSLIAVAGMIEKLGGLIYIGECFGWIIKSWR